MMRHITALFLVATFFIAACGNSDGAILIYNPNGTYSVSTATDTLEEAATAATVAGKTVVVTSPQTLTANVVWPVDRVLKIEKGGIITTTGYTLTINGPFSAGPYQVFTGTGNVVFNASTVDGVYPQWWGALGSNFSDDTVAFEEALLSLTRPDASTYPYNSLKILPGQYKIVRKLSIPYGTAFKGSGSGNTIIQVDADATTDGLGIDGSGSDFNQNGEISNLTIYSTAGKSRDLISLSVASGVKLDKLVVSDAGRYGINAMDTVGIRGYDVIVSGSGVNGLYVNTATPASSIATTSAFFGCAFRTSAAGYGAVVNGIGIDFHSCFFEYNVGGGINIGSGVVSLISPYFEANSAGHNMYIGSNADATLRNSTRVTVINPTQVANAPVDYYALYLNGGVATLIGGNYSTTAKTIYINQANSPTLNMLGAVLSTAPTLSSGTLADVAGFIQYFDVASNRTWQTGAMGVTQTFGSALNATATIAPTTNIVHILNTTETIQTITPPFTGFIGQVTLVPDAAFVTGTSGNIAIASTATIGKAMVMTFDGTKWYPSY